MAYISLAGKPQTDKVSTATEIATQLLAMGWTLYDDQSGSYYKIFRTNGESGTRPWLYLKVEWGGTYVTLNAYAAWNSSTHTTTAPALAMHSNMYATYNLWMFGNKDFVAFVQDNAGVVSSNCIVGHVVSLPASAVNTTTTGSITAGTSVVISVASVTGFVVGARYQIVDTTSGYKQTFLCTAVGGSTITADTITTVGYGSGSLIGTHPFPVFAGANTIVATKALCHHRATYNSTAGALLMTATALSTEYAALSMPYIGTDTKRAFYPPLFTESGLSPTSYHYLGTMDDGNGYIYLSPAINSINASDSYTAADFDVIYMGSNVTGTTTGSNTTTTMNDTSKSWTTNQWANKVLVMTSGTEIGQVRKIISNTATTLTLNVPFTAIPISGTYVIADRAYRHILMTHSFLFREGV